MRQRQVFSGEIQPDLSRKIYPACCRFQKIGGIGRSFCASDDMSKKTVRWVVTIFVITLFVSGAISFLSEELLAHSGMIAAFSILLVIVLVGIVFDILGVAVTSADERPFHSMASRKVPGAQEAIRLLRNAERVGSICNDVIGDICGVISGKGGCPLQLFRAGSGAAAAFLFRGSGHGGRQGDRKGLCHQFLHADRSFCGQGDCRLAWHRKRFPKKEKDR